jgi:hypothetical protein
VAIPFEAGRDRRRVTAPSYRCLIDRASPGRHLPVPARVMIGPACVVHLVGATSAGALVAIGREMAELGHCVAVKHGDHAAILTGSAIAKPRRYSAALLALLAAVKIARGSLFNSSIQFAR